MKVSELFYNPQLEGASSGIPAIFIRLTGCNLCCGGHNGKLVQEGQATFWCDTEPVWLKGQELSNEEVYRKILDFGCLSRVLEGRVRLVITGGEPTTLNHQKAILSFLNYLDICPLAGVVEKNIYSEIETNGTIEVMSHFYSYIQQINCSPKLSNSGMSGARRINGEAIEQIDNHPNSWFKFVVSKEEDILELEETYVKPFKLHWSKIILMPAVDKMKDVPETGKFVIEMAKKYGYRCTLRGHIAVYDQTTGV